MLDIPKIIKEALFFEDSVSISKNLIPSERLLGSDMFVRVYPEKAIVYYLNSSDQIEIPKEYLNLFQTLNTREGERIKTFYKTNLHNFVYLGIELPGIFLYQRDSRGIRNIICQMVLLGTSEIRNIIPELKPWTLSNINSSIEI